MIEMNFQISDQIQSNNIKILNWNIIWLAELAYCFILLCILYS